MIQEEFFTLLDSATSYKVWPLAIPQKSAFPAVRYARVTSTRGQNFDGVENFVSTVFQVDAYAKTHAAALSLAESIKATVNNYAGGTIQQTRLDFEIDSLEESTDLYRVMQNFTLWHTE